VFVLADTGAKSTESHNNRSLAVTSDETKED